jgi:hypothetical protein
MDGGVDSEAPPERRLQGMIMSAGARIADASNKACAAITLGEVAAPSKLLAEVIEMEVAPLHRRMQAIVSELLGPHCSRAQVQFCVVSIMNQCANPLLAEAHADLTGATKSLFREGSMISRHMPRMWWSFLWEAFARFRGAAC